MKIGIQIKNWQLTIKNWSLIIEIKIETEIENKIKNDIAIDIKNKICLSHRGSFVKDIKLWASNVQSLTLLVLRGNTTV